MTVSCNLGRQSPLNPAKILKLEGKLKPQLKRTGVLFQGPSTKPPVEMATVRL